MNRKAIGMVPGVSDTIFLWNGTSYMIEFKTQKGKQSPAQFRWEQKVTSAGFKYFIVRSFEGFKGVVETVLGDCVNEVRGEIKK